MKPSLIAPLAMLAGLLACAGSTPANGGPGKHVAESVESSGTVVTLPPTYNPMVSLAPLVENLGPAVVFLKVETKVEVNRSRTPDLFSPFFSPPESSTDDPEFRTRTGSGSGFIISADGYVLTNNHVVDGADKVTVSLADEREFTGTVVGSDDRTDVALVKIDADQDLPFVLLGDSKALRVGDWVVAIGNPFGLTHTVTAGIVSAKGRVIGAGPYDDFIQTDASINPGNSGGPLFDLNGKVIGINTAIVPGGTGIGFAVPIDMVSEMLDELKSEGRVARGWIGVGLRDLDADLKEQLGASAGVVVSAVYPDQPAAKAGLSPGDVIIGVDGKTTGKSEEVIRAIGLKKPGEEIKLEALREGKARIFKVVLGERPEEDSVATGRFIAPQAPGQALDTLERFGFQVEDRTEAGGVVVSSVVSDGLAGGRLQAGDVIVQINRQRVSKASDVARLLASATRGAVLVVHREGTQLLVTLPAPGK